MNFMIRLLKSLEQLFELSLLVSAALFMSFQFLTLLSMIWLVFYTTSYYICVVWLLSFLVDLIQIWWSDRALRNGLLIKS